MIVDNIEIFKKALKCRPDNKKRMFVHKSFEIVHFDDHNTEAAESVARHIEQHSPLCAFDVHLQDKIVIARLVALDPIIKSDSCFVIDHAKMFLGKMHHFAINRRTGYGPISQKTGNATLDNARFKRCAIVDPRREACNDSLEVVGDQVTTISAGTNSD